MMWDRGAETPNVSLNCRGLKESGSGVLGSVPLLCILPAPCRVFWFWFMASKLKEPVSCLDLLLTFHNSWSYEMKTNALEIFMNFDPKLHDSKFQTSVLI